MVEILIDGDTYEAPEGQTVLETLKKEGFRIPSLCYHPAIKPLGSCRVCAVEVSGRPSGKHITMLSCILKVKPGLEIRTDTEQVKEARTAAFRRLLQMAPQSERILSLAREFQIDTGPPADGCIRCRLCIRVCREIVGPGALAMEKCGPLSIVVPVEGRCIGCGTCANICPTGVIRVVDADNVRTISIRDEIIGRHPLERCEGCGRLYATQRFLDHLHKRSSQHPELKAEHHYCPTCVKLFSDRIESVRRHTRRNC